MLTIKPGETGPHYEVGYYHPNPMLWVTLRRFPNLMLAAAYLNYLNGGDGYYCDERGEGEYITKLDYQEARKLRKKRGYPYE